MRKNLPTSLTLNIQRLFMDGTNVSPELRTLEKLLVAMFTYKVECFLMDTLKRVRNPRRSVLGCVFWVSSCLSNFVDIEDSEISVLWQFQWGVRQDRGRELRLTLRRIHQEGLKHRVRNGIKGLPTFLWQISKVKFSQPSSGGSINPSKFGGRTM